VDQILHANYSIFAEVLLDNFVVRQRQALLVDLSVPSLVDEFTDRLLVGIAVGNEGLNN
jgi:hypothetical protein